MSPAVESPVAGGNVGGVAAGGGAGAVSPVAGGNVGGVAAGGGAGAVACGSTGAGAGAIGGGFDPAGVSDGSTGGELDGPSSKQKKRRLDYSDGRIIK